MTVARVCCVCVCLSKVEEEGVLILGSLDRQDRRERSRSPPVLRSTAGAIRLIV